MKKLFRIFTLLQVAYQGYSYIKGRKKNKRKKRASYRR